MIVVEHIKAREKRNLFHDENCLSWSIHKNRRRESCDSPLLPENAACPLIRNYFFGSGKNKTEEELTDRGRMSSLKIKQHKWVEAACKGHLWWKKIKSVKQPTDIKTGISLGWLTCKRQQEGIRGWRGSCHSVPPVGLTVDVSALSAALVMAP